MIPKKYTKYITISIIILLFFLVYLILKPFLILVLSGCVLAYIFYPVFNRLNKIIKYKTPTAFLTTILVLLIIFIPSFFLMISLQEQAISFYHVAKEKIEYNDMTIGCTEDGKGIGCDLIKKIEGDDAKSYVRFDEVIKKFSNSIISIITDFLIKIPGYTLKFIVVLFVMYFLFKDGKYLIQFIKDLINISNQKKEVLFLKIKNISDTIIFGNLIFGIFEGLLGVLGFWILGLPSPLLWGIAMGLASFIPFVGTSLIWVPATLILFIEGFWIKGFILAAYGLIVIGGVDALLKPIIIGEKSKIHPVIILLGVLGGIPLFGFLGIIFGPLIVAIAITILENIRSEKKGEKKDDTIKSKTNRN